MERVSVDKLCAVVEVALRTASDKQELSAPVTREARMGEPAEWDSLSFVVVFNAIAEEFGIELEDDDAIHFTAIETMHGFLEELAD